MGVQKQVFASNAEKQNFYKLSDQWGDKYRIYHNLPFLNIFDTKNLIDIVISPWPFQLITINDADYSRLEKTSVDYTLCDDSDEPLICIDFDEYQDGYNADTKYHETTASNRWGETIYDLKLKVARGSHFLYLVLGSKEFAYLSNDIRLTIVDGIIGDALAVKTARVKFAETFDPEEFGFTREEFYAMDGEKIEERYLDWLTGVELEMNFEHNPIYKKAAELSMELGSHAHNYELIHPPEVDKASSQYGEAKVSIESPVFGKVEASVTLPYFKPPFFSGPPLVEEIAHILALEKLRRLMQKKPNQSLSPLQLHDL